MNFISILIVDKNYLVLSLPVESYIMKINEDALLVIYWSKWYWDIRVFSTGRDGGDGGSPSTSLKFTYFLPRTPPPPPPPISKSWGPVKPRLSENLVGGPTPPHQQKGGCTLWNGGTQYRGSSLNGGGGGLGALCQLWSGTASLAPLVWRFINDFFSEFKFSRKIAGSQNFKWFGKL